MVTLYEKCNTGDDGNDSVFGATWHGQTFTPVSAHTITSIKLLLWKSSGNPGLLTASIRETDVDGKPTGSDLTSGTTNGNTLPVGTPYEWREISFGAGTLLAASTKYAIILRAPDAPVGVNVRWRFNTNSDSYANGQRTYSTDSGSTWTTLIADKMFEDWGSDPTFTPKVIII